MSAPRLTVTGVALRVAIGTLVYALIVLLSAPLPTATGLMLTFPALNGLAFYFSAPADAKPIARSMLWMPIVNGIMCAGYIVLFLWLAPLMPPAALAWALVLLAVAGWTAAVTRRFVRQGIAQENQLPYGVVVTLVGAMLVLGAAHLLPNDATASAVAAAQRGVADFAVNGLERSAVKIVLFAAVLCIFLAAPAFMPVSDSTRGILAGLPLLPLAGLVSVAADNGLDLAQRLQAFRAMAVSIWLSPAAPFWFICAMSAYFGAQKAGQGALSFLVLVCAWLVCLFAILSLSFGIDSL